MNLSRYWKNPIMNLWPNSTFDHYGYGVLSTLRSSILREVFSSARIEL